MNFFFKHRYVSKDQHDSIFHVVKRKRLLERTLNVLIFTEQYVSVINVLID